MTIHDTLSWLKENGFPSSRAALYRLTDSEGFPRPVLDGRKGRWDRAAVEAWRADRQQKEDDAWRKRSRVTRTVDEIYHWAMLTSAEGPSWQGEVIRWAETQDDDTERLLTVLAGRLKISQGLGLMRSWQRRQALKRADDDRANDAVLPPL